MNHKWRDILGQRMRVRRVVGEVDLAIETTEGHQDTIVFQIAEVNKALLSISDRVDNTGSVVFDQDDETGEDLTHIFNKRTDKKMKVR